MSNNLVNRSAFTTQLEYEIAVLAVLATMDSDSIFYFYELSRRSFCTNLTKLHLLLQEAALYLTVGEEVPSYDRQLDFDKLVSSLPIVNTQTLRNALVAAQRANYSSSPAPSISKVSERLLLSSEITDKMAKLSTLASALVACGDRFLGSGLHEYAAKSMLLGSTPSNKTASDRAVMQAAVESLRAEDWRTAKYSGACTLESPVSASCSSVNSLPYQEAITGVNVDVGGTDYSLAFIAPQFWEYRVALTTFSGTSSVFPIVSAAHTFSFVKSNTLFTVSLGTVSITSTADLATKLGAALAAYDIFVANDGDTLVFSGSQTGSTFRFRLPWSSASSVNTTFSLVDPADREIRGSVGFTLPTTSAPGVSVSATPTLVGSYSGSVAFVSVNTQITAATSALVGDTVVFNRGYYRVISVTSSSLTVSGTVVLPYSGSGFYSGAISFTVVRHVVVLTGTNSFTVSATTELAFPITEQVVLYKELCVVDPTTFSRPIRVGDSVSIGSTTTSVASSGAKVTLSQPVPYGETCTITSGWNELFTSHVATLASYMQGGMLFQDAIWFENLRDLIASGELGTELASLAVERLTELDTSVSAMLSALSNTLPMSPVFYTQFQKVRINSAFVYELLVSLSLRSVFTDTRETLETIETLRALVDPGEDLTVVSNGRSFYA
jgi:hypothetical protein